MAKLYHVCLFGLQVDNDADHIALFHGPDHIDPTWFTEDAEELYPQDIAAGTLSSSDARLQEETKASSPSRRELEDELGWCPGWLCMGVSVQLPSCIVTT